MPSRSPVEIEHTQNAFQVARIDGSALKNTPHIAIVDDDEAVREALSGLVETAGYVAETFASARDFLNSSRLGRTDCLILDANAGHEWASAAARPAGIRSLHSHDFRHRLSRRQCASAGIEGGGNSVCAQASQPPSAAQAYSDGASQ